MNFSTLIRSGNRAFQGSGFGKVVLGLLLVASPFLVMIQNLFVSMISTLQHLLHGLFNTTQVEILSVAKFKTSNLAKNNQLKNGDFQLKRFASKSLLSIAMLVLMSSVSWGQSAGFNNTFIVLSLNGGANTFYDLNATTANTDFNGASLGTFAAGSSNLILKGAEHNVYKCGGADLTSTRLNYRIYPTGSPSGSYTAQNIGFTSGFGNGCGGQDQVWSNTGLTANLLTGLGTGSYTIEVYSDATITCCGGTAFASNSGNNYKATFTVSSIIWTNTGAATAWYTNTNWTPNTASGAWLTGSVAEFQNAGTATTAGINMTTASLSIGQIDITAARTRTLTIGSSSSNGTLTLNGATVGGNANVILRNSSTSLLTLQNNETGTGKTMNIALGNATTNRIDAAGSGGITISSAISGASRSITKIGTGTLTLSGTNTYSGGTIISGGTVSAGAAANLGDAAGAITLGSGATSATLAATGSFTRNVLNVTTSSSAGVIDVAASQTLTLAALNTASGTDNTTKIGKSGAGTLTLSGAGSYVGQTQIGQGTVIVSNNAGLGTNNSTVARGIDLGLNVGDVSQANNVSVLATTGITVPQSIYVAPNTTAATRTIGTSGATASATFSNEVYLDGSATLAPVSAGTLTMSGNIINTGGLTTTTGTTLLSGTNTYSGTTTVSSGTLRIGSTSALGSTAAGTSITSGAVLDLNGINYSSAEALTVNGTGISSGGAIINSSATGATYAGLLTLGSTSRIVGGTGTIAISNAGTITGSGFGLTLGGAQGGSLASVIGTGTGTLTKQDAGTWTLTNSSNTYTGTTTITGGEIRLNPVANATFASQIVLNGGKLSTTGIAATRTWTNSSTLNLNANSIIDLGSNAHTITFGNSSGVTWAGTTLTINGWTGTAGASGMGGKIIVGAGGLLPSQLSKISFSGYPGTPIILAGELVPPAPAVTYTWTGATDGVWGTSTNWSPNGVPGSIDNVTLNQGTAGPAFANLNLTSAVTVTNITFAGTGSFFTVGAAGSITATGNVTYTSGTGTWNCASTFTMSSSSVQTIPPFNYGNLNATGGNRTLPSSGTVGICGTFTRGAGAYTVTGSTVNFNGTGAQTIAVGTYNNLTISNARGSANLTSPAGTIAVGGTFDVSTLSAYTPVVNASSIFDFTSAGVQTVPAFFYGRINHTGNGNRTWASSGIIDINQGFGPGTGTHTITGSTVRYSNTSATTWTLSTFTTNLAAPARQYNNLIFNGGASTIWSLNGITLGVANDLTVTSGTVQVGSTSGVGILNVDGNLAIDGANGILNLSASATNAGTINLLGNFVQSNGSFNKSGAATGIFNFAKTVSFPVQTISQSAGTITNNGTTWNLGTGSTPNVVEFASNVTMSGGTVNANDQVSVDFNTFVLTSTGTFAANTGTTLITANTNATGAIMASGANGSVQSTTRTFTNTGVNYTFNGTAAQFTGTAIASSANIGTLNLSNTSGANPALTFTSSPTVATALNVNNGINQLGANNITISATTAASVTGGSSTAFIQTNGLGRLIRAIATAGLPINYNFPVGTATNYTPAAFNFTANAGAMNLIVGTVGSRNTNDVTPTDYINNRYWVTNLSGTPSTYAYTSTFTFITSPTDVVGTIGNIRLNRFGGTTWTEDATSSASGSLLTSSSLNQGTGSLSATAEWAGRVNPPFATYTWDGSANNGSWDDAANWDLNAVPSSSSDVIIIPDVAPLAALAISGTRAVADFTVQTNGTFSMAASSQLTISGNYTYSSSTAATFNCSSTLILSSSTAQTLPAANYGNLNLAGGARTLTSGATTRICGNYTPGTSTTAGTSIVEFNGTAAQSITAASNFATFNCTGVAGTVSANGNLTVATAMTISAGDTLNQVSGTLTISSTTTNVNGTLRNSASADIVQTSATVTVGATGMYDHNRNGGNVLTSTWTAGSNCIITGCTTSEPTNLGQTFSDFTWKCLNQAASRNLSGTLTSVRDLNITNTNTFNLGFVASTGSLALNISRDFNISSGFPVGTTGTISPTITVGGNLNVTGGGFTLANSASSTGTASMTVAGTANISSTSGTSLIVGASASKVATITVTGLITKTNTGTVSIGQGTAVSTLTANGGLTVTNGTINVSNGGSGGVLTLGSASTLTINGGTLIGSATAHTSTINANGNVTVSSGTLTLSNAATTSTMTVANDRTMTVDGTGIVNVAVLGIGNLNIGTSTSVVTTTALTINGGSLILASGGTGTINAYSDLNLTSGTISRSSGTATINFLKPGLTSTIRGTSVITQATGTLSGVIAINVGNGTLIYPLLVLGSSTINIGANTTLTVLANGMLDCGASNVLTGNSFVLNAQGTLLTANTLGITTGATGSIQTTTRNFGTLGYFIYNGTSAQVTGNAFPASCAILTIFNSTGVTLTSPVTIFAGGQLILFISPLGGFLDLAGNNLTLQATSTVVGASATNYVKTSGVGRLIKSVSTSPVLFEVGNATYNPLILTPSVGSNIPYQVRVIDAVTSPAPNDDTKLINRYWSITAPTAAANTLTMNGQWNTGQQNTNYNAGSQVKVAYHNGTTWAEINSSQLGVNPFISVGAFALSAANINSGVTFGIGKDNGFIGTYVWDGSASSSWTDQNNWTPASAVGGPLATDNVAITAPGTNTLNLTGSHTITNFDLSGTGTFIMGSGSALTINGDLTYSSSATPSLDCNSTINIANSTSQPVPAFNYGNLNGTGGARVLANSGTIGICGSFTRGAGAYTVTGSTVNYNGTGAQIISVGTYNNLTISNARGSANLTSPAGSISVSGTFDVSSLSAYTPVVNAASIFDFTSASAQSIPAFFYGQLNNSGNGARTWASSGIIDINQNFSPGSSSHTVTGSSVRYSNTAANTFSLASFTSSATPRHYNNLEIVGGATTNYNLASGFNMGCAGNFVYSGAGTFTVAVNATANTMTVNGDFTKTGAGTVLIANTATATLVNALNVIGNTTISSGILNNVGSASSTTVQGNFTTNDLTISGTGAMNMDAASNTAFSSVTINGNLSVTSITANAINFGSGTSNANNVINLKGNLTKSGPGTFGCTGTFAPSSGFFFNLGSSTQTYSYAGTAMTVSNFTVAASSTLQLLTNMVLGSNASASTLTVIGTLDAGALTVSPGNAANDFDMQATGILSTNSASGVSGTISGFAVGLPAFASGATFIFTGTSVNTGMSTYTDISTAKQYTITWSGTTSLTLDESLNLNVFNFTNNGLIFLGNFDIFLTSAAGALTGSGFGVTKMFVTNGTGSLSRAVVTAPAGLPFTWPIGENTGVTEYSPVTVASIAGAGINGTIAFRVVDGIQPNNSPAISYISRYWPTTVTGFNVGYTLSNLTFKYESGDIVVGPEGSLRGNSYSTSLADWTQYASSSCGSDLLTITSGISGSNMPTNGTYDITARIDVPVYYRTVSSGPWQTVGNWEVSSDPAFISPAPSAAIQAPTNLNSEGINIRSTHAITTASTITVDNMTIESGGSMTTTNNSFTVANGTGTDLTVNSGGTLQFSSASNNSLIVNTGALIQVDGLMRQSSSASPDVTNSGTINIGATGTYEHARNAGIIPTCSWASGSTCLVSGVGNNMPSGLGQAFHHFTVNTTLTASVNCSANLTTINGDFNLTTNHATNEFRLSTGTTYTLTIGGNFNITNSFFSPASGGAGPCNVVVNGTTTMNGATSRIDKSGAATVNYTFNGDYTQNAGTFDFNSAGSSNTTVNFRGNVIWNGSILRTNGGTHTINFDKTAGLQTLNCGATFGAGAINWNVSGTSNTLRLLSNLALSNSLQTFTVNTGTTMDFQTFILSGGNTTFTTGTSPTLMIGSTAGIMTAGNASGNIQTLVRTVNGTTTYIYTGTANQNSGNLLPSTLTGAGRLTITNTGAVSNNTVTLTNTLPMTTPQLNLTSGFLAIGSSQVVVISSGGTVNGTGGDFATGATGGMIRCSSPAGGVFNGNLNPFNVETNGSPCGINFGAQTVAIQSGGVFTINAGGFVNTNPPAYAVGSNLQYSTGASFGRGLEWSTTSGKGYPHHVNVNTTTLNPASSPGAPNANMPFQCGGNLTISSGGNIYMDFGGNNMSEDLRVLGNFNLQGNFSLSQTSGSDLFVGGNWINNGTGTNAFMTGVNGREVIFNGSGAQSIGGSNTTVPAFAFLAITKSSGDVTLNFGSTSTVTVNNRFQVNSGKFILGSHSLVLAPGCAAMGTGDENNYVVTNGTGVFRQQVLNNAADFWYPVGPSTTVFGPITMNQAASGTTDNINVRVVVAPTFTNAVNDNLQMVNLEWRLTEGVAGGNRLTNTYGWRTASEATNFLRDEAVYVGNWDAAALPSPRYRFQGTVNPLGGSNPWFAETTPSQPFTGNLNPTRPFVVGNINGLVGCFQTAAATDWNTGTTWVGGVVPPTDALTCISHNITCTATPTGDPGGINFQAGGNVAVSPGVTITLTDNAPIINSSGAVRNFGGGTIAFSGLGLVSGGNAVTFNNLQLNGNTTFSTVPTISNEMEILPGGFVISSNGPNYGSSSTLKYNTGVSYGRSNEWRSTSGAGYPANVLVTGNTALNLDNGTGVNRAIQGNMQIDNGSSVSQGATSFGLIVPGNFTLNGAYTQSTTFGGDLVLGGNWSSAATASLTANNRDVRFNGTSSTQTIANLASGLQFGFLTVDNTTVGGVDLLNTITANTFRVNASRTFNLTSDKIIISPGGNVQINGTFNAGSGTIEYTNGGNFTNDGTFNRGTSTVDFLSTTPGVVVGSVQTNFHNLRLAPSSSVNFNSGALRGRVSGTLQMRAGSFCIGNAPIYEAGSKLMYSGGGTFNRNVEWDPATLQKVEVTNNTTVKCGSNGTGFSHVMADSLIIQSGSTFDMSGPDMTAPTVVGGSVQLRGTLTLSNTAGGDLEVAGDWQNDGGTFNSNGRLTTFNGSSNGSIKGSSNTTFSFLTVNKGINKTLTASVPFTISRPPGGTTLQISGGIFDLNGQTLSLGSGSNTLRIDAGFINGQTLRTGGTSITAFSNFRSNGSNTDTLGGKVDYSGSGAETLISPVKGYNLLWITGGSTKTISQNTRVNDSLWIAPSTTLDFGASASILESRGNVVNNGSTIGSGTGKIELKGLAVQNMSGNGIYRNLDVNNTNNVNSTGTPTISSKLNVVLGKVLQASASDSITLGSTATITEVIGGGEHFVRGKLSTTRTVGISAETFGGMGVELTAGANLGTVVVTRQSGLALTGEAPCCIGFTSINRNWVIRPSIQPSIADRNLTITWQSEDDNSMDMTNLQLWKRSGIGSPWESIDAIQDVSLSNPRSASWSGVSSFSQFTGADLNNPLPLSLLRFNARNEKGNGLLTWTIENGENHASYKVEKSLDGKNFSEIGTIAANDKRGEKSYQFVDKDLRRDSYYRIRLIENSGKAETSNVAIVRLGSFTLPEIQLYPNPSNAGSRIMIDGNMNSEGLIDVAIFGTDGKENAKFSGEFETVNSRFETTVKSLPAGLYQIKVISSDQVKTMKLVKR
jgi:autotransporter-associated beta strand protein